jgi:flagellar assembly protein FliH
VDAFFINGEFLEKETGTIPEESRTSEPAETINSSGEENPTSGEESIDISRITGFAEQLKAYIEGGQEQAVAAEEVQENTRISQPEQDVGDFREVMEKAKSEAERIFCGAKSQADELANSARSQAEVLTQNARVQADELTQNAKYQAEELAQTAKIQADSILEGAKNKFSELTEGAKQQASSILEGAKQQAGDITFGASHKAEQIIDEARQNAKFITESANQKAAGVLENAQQQSDEIIKNAEQKAAELFETTKQQTEEMLIRAKEQAVEISAQAKQEGFEAGHSEGLTKANQEFEKKLAEALMIISRSEEARMDRIQSSEMELLKLAAAIAEKIIGEELKTNSQSQIAIVKQALAGVPSAGTITIKVNPEDHRFIEENLPEFQKVFSEPVPIKIQRDQGVGMGNCFIETDHGNIDARIKTQLDMIMAEILKMGQPECS